MEKQAPSPPLPDLQSLADLTTQTLRAQWSRWFGAPPPKKLRRDLLALALAYRMQERAYGGLSTATRKHLRELAAAFQDNRVCDLAEPPRLTPGTRLIRQWKDEMHQVIVEDTGFLYRGTRYRSLTKIARQITGTAWSGPLFFGLKKEAKKRRPLRHGA